MKILAFDTCLDKMYVALGNETGVLASKIVENTKTTYHSAFLISTITNILKENDLTPEDIDAISINVGPGSFTGIRACTTVARVMAQELNIKTIGVSSLEILSKINPSDSKTLVALDARKEMAYVAIYENNKEIFGPKAILLEELKTMLKKEPYYLITDDSLVKQIGGISYQQEQYDLGDFLVKIATEKLKSNCETDWQKLLPLYIQPPAINKK